MAKAVKDLAEKKLVRYSDAELEYFKILIQKKIQEVKIEILGLKGLLHNPNGTEETGKSFLQDDGGSEGYSREINMNLIGRQEFFLVDLKNALLRVNNKTYGICRITGNKIPKVRLQACLVATACVDAKMDEDEYKKTYRRR